MVGAGSTTTGRADGTTTDAGRTAGRTCIAMPGVSGGWECGRAGTAAMTPIARSPATPSPAAATAARGGDDRTGGPSERTWGPSLRTTSRSAGHSSGATAPLAGGSGSPAASASAGSPADSTMPGFCGRARERAGSAADARECVRESVAPPGTRVESRATPCVGATRSIGSGSGGVSASGPGGRMVARPSTVGGTIPTTVVRRSGAGAPSGVTGEVTGERTYGPAGDG
jgi:hypothetical protein